jgi:hypothetical protein
MPKFKKKPIVVEAFQMTQERRTDNRDWPGWMGQAWQKERGEVGSLYPTIEGTGDGTISIGTLEGPLLVSWGDYIIQGVQGEIYPCKPDIFEATYGPAEDDQCPEVAEARKAIKALYLEVPSGIMNDVESRVEAAFLALQS